MDRFDRQRRIPGWDQRRLAAGRVLIFGRDFTGCFTVWAAASMGVGEIIWVGAPCPATTPLANHLLARPSPFSDSTILAYPFDIEFGPEIEWAAGHRRIDLVISCGENTTAHRHCLRFSQSRACPFLSATAAQGGWIGTSPPPFPGDGRHEPVTAMLVAGLLTDAIRSTLCPLPGDGPATCGPIGLQSPPLLRDRDIVLIGAGGIGVYAATLAVLLGSRLCIVDSDIVEETNLNRQGLFTAQHAESRAFKSAAAAEALSRMFPGASILTRTARVGPDFAAELARMPCAFLLSAVDNAETRLVLQSLAASLNVPVVQGGTSGFAADCFTQTIGGKLLDAQMHGALSSAAQNESSRSRGGGCAAEPAYVVPGMICGALMLHRCTTLSQGDGATRPIRWRSGNFPVEDRTPDSRLHFHECLSL